MQRWVARSRIDSTIWANYRELRSTQPQPQVRMTIEALGATGDGRC